MALTQDNDNITPAQRSQGKKSAKKKKKTDLDGSIRDPMDSHLCLQREDGFRIAMDIPSSQPRAYSKQISESVGEE